ncbi:MAG: 3-oxo-5-alpha-steroid 4-dehydrogenase [Muribaculum sp.]|nr:3-oxo-5-alpha-steroid 4-dehydrogenase [Muribaculaceae bacterium]MCM1080323.1 3-oxo-5-alpha-steroid 4-dehydrogenase [Muribaculum sp.]
MLDNLDFFNAVLVSMAVLAVVVFVALHRVTAGYGMMRTAAWGPSIPNRLGWVLMEAPAFVAMLLLWIISDRAGQLAPAVMASLFLVHYFQRSFIFPLLIKGNSRMPLAIIAMGIMFNVINAYLIGGWLFYLSPADMYATSWLASPQFIAGTVLFIAGMGINIQSDNIVRHLRRPGDMSHYIPRGGMYNYVTSANYLGEFVEWVGFAVLTWSWAGAVFALWTFANLAPRARSIHHRYLAEFGDDYRRLNRRYIIPFIY